MKQSCDHIIFSVLFSVPTNPATVKSRHFQFVFLIYNDVENNSGSAEGNSHMKNLKIFCVDYLAAAVRVDDYRHA